MHLARLGYCGECCVERGRGSHDDPACEGISKEVKDNMAIGTVA